MAGVPFVDLWPDIDRIRDQLLAGFESVLDSGRYVLGPEVERFEQSFAAYCGTRHVVAVNSGTSALVVALLAAGIGEGDEVIVPGMTFVATAVAVRHVGAVPVLVDVDRDSQCLDPTHLPAALSPRTRAIIPVHLYGRIADMTAIGEFAESNGLIVIEDAAQAHGASRDNRRAGAFGHIGCFSFYPSKNLGALGEGGAVATDDADLAQRAARLRDWGQIEKGVYALPGANYRMDSLQGMALSHKLPLLDGWNAARRRHSGEYHRLLGDLNLGTVVPSDDHVVHVQSIFHPSRDLLRERLAAEGIQTGLHYPRAVHQHPGLEGYRIVGSLAVAAEIAATQLSLPMYPALTETQIESVALVLRKAVT